MAVFAIIDQGIVTNIIEAETNFEVQMFFPEKLVVLSTLETGYPYVGEPYFEDLNRFKPASPFASWVFNAERFEWEPPIPYPEDGKRYSWAEASASWEELELNLD